MICAFMVVHLGAAGAAAVRRGSLALGGDGAAGPGQPHDRQGSSTCAIGCHVDDPDEGASFDDLLLLQVSHVLQRPGHRRPPTASGRPPEEQPPHAEVPEPSEEDADLAAAKVLLLQEDVAPLHAAGVPAELPRPGFAEAPCGTAVRRSEGGTPIELARKPNGTSTWSIPAYRWDWLPSVVFMSHGVLECVMRNVYQNVFADAGVRAAVATHPGLGGWMLLLLAMLLWLVMMVECMKGGIHWGSPHLSESDDQEQPQKEPPPAGAKVAMPMEPVQNTVASVARRASERQRLAQQGTSKSCC